jgi:rifampicin phosphotransferase
MKPVIFLSDVPDHPEAAAWVGGKAYNLARLMKAGFPVPAGFCLTRAACDQFLAGAGMAEPVKRLLELIDLSPEIKASQIQEAVMQNRLPEEISSAAARALDFLGLQPAAVRSSAVEEDGPDFSFAGQYRSLLDVDRSSLEQAILSCWSSMWSPEALAYRQKHGQDGNGLALPLVVQRMIQADWAGVVFTADPVTGEEQLVIEAVEGKAEKLVSGEAAPVRVRLEKPTLRLLEQRQPEQGQINLPGELIQEVGSLALQVEQFFGGPQDIEWAWQDGMLHLLQARPVTALPADSLYDARGQVDMQALLRRAEGGGSEIWTDDNVGEVFPDAVTPLTWSVLDQAGSYAFCGFLRRAGVSRCPEKGLFGRFYGRVYFNQSQFQRLMTRFYPSQAGKDSGRLSRRAALILSLAKTGVRSALWIPLNLWAANQTLRRSQDSRPDAKTFSDADLRYELQRWRKTGRTLMDRHLTTTIFAALLLGLLDKLVQLYGSGEVEPAHLTGGLEGMRSAEIGRDLQALASLVQQDPELKNAFAGSGSEVTGALAALPKEHPFWAAFHQFLEKHGHASMQEFELSFPRWREQPRAVLRLLKPHLEKSSADLPLQDPVRHRIEAVAGMRRRLGWGTRRLVFELLLPLAQHYSVARENMKYSFVKAHGVLRELYLELAFRLVSQQKLPHVDSIFFLEDVEITALQEENLLPEEAVARIDQRRLEYEGWRWNARSAPKLIEERAGKILPIRTAPALQPAVGEVGDDLLRGVAASAGCYSGRARVIHDPSQTSQLEPGEILVARATNPAWAPLLLSAGALVTEIGGLLSHGAIVAREYGLPAVLNVPEATGLIRTGQILRVDGSAGTVQILEQGSTL